MNTMRRIPKATPELRAALARASFPNDLGGYPGFEVREKQRRKYNTTPLTPADRFGQLFGMFSLFSSRFAAGPSTQKNRGRIQKIIRHKTVWRRAQKLAAA